MLYIGNRSSCSQRRNGFIQLAFERLFTMEEKKTSAHKKGLFIAVGILCMLLLMGAGVFTGMHYQEWMDARYAEAERVTPELDDAAQDWTGAAPPSKNGEQQGIKIPGYASISIPAGETDAKILLLNPEENPCYFSFELILDETGESLFTSKMVEPGKAIQEETLARALEAGEYDATIKISTYSLDTNTQMNGANVKTKLLVG